VIYGGNTLKEMIDGPDEFFGARRLWLCQYGSTPTLPDSWDEYFMWQYTDGVYGPTPHSIDGIGPCDINSYNGDADQLIAEWATGSAEPNPTPPQPVPSNEVAILVAAPPGITLRFRQIQLGQGLSKHSFRLVRQKESKG